MVHLTVADLRTKHQRTLGKKFPAHKVGFWNFKKEARDKIVENFGGKFFPDINNCAKFFEIHAPHYYIR